MAQEGLDQCARQFLQIKTGSTQAIDIRHFNAVNPFHGQHIAAGALPIHGRHTETFIFLDILGNFGQSRRFQPQIHLDTRGLCKRFSHHDRTQTARHRYKALLQTRNHEEAFEILRETLTHARTDDFHRNFARTANKAGCTCAIEAAAIGASNSV